MGAAALIGVSLLMTAAAPAVQPAAQKLTDGIETGFRACSLQLTSRSYLTAANAAELKKVGVILGGTPRADVVAMANRALGAGIIYASVQSDSGVISLAGSATVPACKVVVADTELSLTARMAWADKLRGTSGWTYDKTRSGMNGNLMRDMFVLNATRPGTHMVVILDGPNIVWQDGKGIQMIMTVVVDTTKAQ